MLCWGDFSLFRQDHAPGSKNKRNKLPAAGEPEPRGPAEAGAAPDASRPGLPAQRGWERGVCGEPVGAG